MKRLVVLFILLVACTVPLSAGGAGGETGFLLGGDAQNAQDPQNPANDVIKIDTTSSGSYGTVSRRLGVKIAALDDMLEFKSFYQNRSCGGGSPRFALTIDLNGDGVPDGDVWAYSFPFTTGGCPQNLWNYDDLTDAKPRWDASPLVTQGFPTLYTICSNPLFNTNPAIAPLCPFVQNSSYVPWKVFETVLTTLYPNHQICSAALVDDSSWLAGAAGVAYYDIISMGRATWEDSQDSVGRGFARGCTLPDDGDFEVPGDENHDHTVNDDDRTWKSRHSDNNVATTEGGSRLFAYRQFHGGIEPRSLFTTSRRSLVSQVLQAAPERIASTTKWPINESCDTAAAVCLRAGERNSKRPDCYVYTFAACDLTLMGAGWTPSLSPPSRGLLGASIKRAGP
jgi:hypothetical protein